MFKVNHAEWSAMVDADCIYIRKWRQEKFHAMDTHAEDITLPSGKGFRVFCDEHGRLLEGGAGREVGP